MTCGEPISNQCQNLKEQICHLISDLSTVCFQAFQKPYIDRWLTCLVYEANYSHLFQVEVSNSALTFPCRHLKRLSPQMRQNIKTIFTIHPQRQRLKLTGQHYAVVAQHLMEDYLSLKPQR